MGKEVERREKESSRDIDRKREKREKKREKKEREKERKRVIYVREKKREIGNHAKA